MLRTYQKQLRNNHTHPEYRLCQFLRNRRLGGYKFKRQQIIDKYIVDFVCHEKKLIIELDGWHHELQIEKDEKRTRHLEKLGYKVLRFWNSDLIDNIGLPLNAILKTLEQTPS